LIAKYVKNESLKVHGRHHVFTITVGVLSFNFKVGIRSAGSPSGTTKVCGGRYEYVVLVVDYYQSKEQIDWLISNNIIVVYCS